ncbi:MAG: rRNA maturation RNase YbeY [Campylobacterota bacterium]|nr:rRNA maturation RNase YbeY [Campylobacterota bacterium]
MIDFENRTETVINLLPLDTIKSYLKVGDIELIITDNQDIKEINREFRSIDKPTDVLSFPYEPMPMGPVGSIVISVDYVRNVSKELRHSFEDELSLLFIHGLLHLIGYDHEVDRGEMRLKEEAVIGYFNLPDSLIIRNEEK